MDLSVPVALLHVAAFSLGYFLCKGLSFNEKTCRTVSIETGALPSSRFLIHFRDPQAGVTECIICLNVL